ncbi:MAG TPA: OsmC family protein [Allosphingosinicella sp.]|nr:OsmC family protein [Allosphingosinicella sp.]
MSEHLATIEWHSDGNFREGRYSRVHRISFDGGAEMAGSASPQIVRAPMSDASAVDPEEMLVASAAACHMLWFLDLARRAGLAIASYRDEARGVIGNLDGRTALTRIVLRPRIAFEGEPPDDATLARLHHEAHEYCFIANSLRSEVTVES